MFYLAATPHIEGSSYNRLPMGNPRLWDGTSGLQRGPRAIFEAPSCTAQALKQQLTSKIKSSGNVPTESIAVRATCSPPQQYTEPSSGLHVRPCELRSFGDSAQVTCSQVALPETAIFGAAAASAASASATQVAIRVTQVAWKSSSERSPVSLMIPASHSSQVIAWFKQSQLPEMKTNVIKKGLAG